MGELKIVNLDKITSKIIVMTGRYKHIPHVACSLIGDLLRDITFMPRNLDYYKDYPMLIDEFYEKVKDSDKRVVLSTQSKEFIECLLYSEIDFQLVTVRFDDEDNCFRLRVLEKSEALENMKAFDMEFR